MYQAWPWGGTASASPTSGFVQPTATTQVATTQWPAGYSQYAVTPEIQQQWAAWATQAQYAYGSNVPVGEAQTTTAFTGVYPDYQTATTVSTNETKKPDDTNSATEKPKSAAEQPLSQDLPESDKIKQLKEQAEKWSNQQPAASSWAYSTASTNTASSNVNATTVTAPNESSRTLASTNVTQSGLTQGHMSKEEEEFERQFKDWEKQFETWKQQNQNHPDKEAFAQYEKQWQEWRAQLLQKKEQMQKAKAEQLASMGGQGGFVNTQTNSTNITDTSASTSTTAMYYQHPQYMYMQPYVYPGATTVAPAAVPTAVVPPAVVPPAVVPPAMVPPAGVPPVSMPPAAMQSAVTQQMPYNVPAAASDNYGNQPLMGMSGPPRNDMNYDSQRAQDYENDRDMYNYGPGPMRRNGPRDDGMGPGSNFEGFENSNMPEEGDYQRDNWKFGRGRGRGGRGRARGRGRDRWSEPTDMDVRPGGIRNQRKTLLPGGPGTFPEDDGPPPFEYPTEDCRDQFSKEDRPFPDGPNRPHDDRFSYHDGHQQYPQDESFDERYPPDPNQYPPDQEYPERFPPDHERFPPDQRFPPDRKRFPPDHERFPLDERFPPENERFPPDQERFPPGREGFPPGKERFPRGQDRFPDHERFPPDDERFPRDDRFPPDQERFPPDPERFPPDQERFPPPKGGRFPPDDNRFPPDDNRFPPDDERFPPGPERFSQRHMMDEGGFGDREFDQFPPEDDMYGPPPFREDFPPFDERGGRGGRGRFAGRGRRFRGDFDRFGPPFPPRMRNEPFGPDFPPPDDRFGFPGDGPPRMPPPRGMRPPFEPPPPFGPRGRFPDEPFFGDGPDRYKSIDYTHRPASAVMGDDFNPHYEFESEFQDDVNSYRARPAKRKKRDSQKKSTVEKKKDKEKEKDKDKEKEKEKEKDEDKDKDKDD